MALAARLKESRTLRGLNLTQAAEELGVARTAYRLWERDAAIPAPEFWRRIAFWCDAPLASILRDVGLLNADEEQALLELAARELRRRKRHH